MRARFVLAIIQYVQSRLHVVAKLAELLLQRFHHRGAVFVSSLREMVGPGLRLVENSTRLLPSQFGHVFLPGEELRLLVGRTYRVCRTRLRRSDDGVGLRLRAVQTKQP